MKGVTAQFLLEGSFYALEQCGLLLRSASILFDEKQLSPSIVLTAFAREELGRSRILFDALVRVEIKNETVSDFQIETLCDDHVRKQEWAQVAHAM